MRGVGVGDGLGVGVGDGVGVWASASSGSVEAVKLAAPSAGSTFRNFRLLFEVLIFFIVFVSLWLDLVNDAEVRRDYH